MSIELSNFWFKYEGAESWALKDINLVIRRGETVGIIGPSGGGKTTLLMAISGIIPNYVRGERKGVVMVDGVDPWLVRLPEMAVKVGMVLQDSELQLFMPRVIDEVAFGPENLCLPPCEVLRRVKESILKLRLEGLEERDTYTLSSGQKQRVAIASVLSMGQSILLMDEPLSRLDETGRRLMVGLIRELRGRRVTIVIAEHHVHELLELVDRIIMIEDGKVALDSPTESIRSILNNQLNGGGGALALSRFTAWHDASNPIMPRYRTRNNASQPVIELDDVHYEYPGGIKALSGIMLKVYPGEFIGVIGENGSGKSTLIKIIMGLMRPRRGIVRVLGIEYPRVEDLIGRVGYVPENPDWVIFESTVFDEVAYTLRRLGVNEDEVARRVTWALAMVNLAGFEGRDPLALSFGERRRVTIASAIAIKPSILLLDEPTVGLDARNAIKVMEVLKELQVEYGATVVVISHEHELLKTYADRILEMRNGKILRLGGGFAE